MRTVYSRILLWALLTMFVSMGMFFFISNNLEMHLGFGDAIRRLLVLDLTLTGQAYEAGGRTRAAAVIEEGRRTLGWQYYVVDRDSRDLATGEDRAALVRLLGDRWSRPVSTPQGLLFGTRTPDRKYSMLAWVILPFDPLTALPYYGLILLTIAALTWPIAWHIYSPLRSLARKLELFGRGDLTVRANLRRRDEVGEIARAFDSMADRIATLMTAERRLLQDVSHELRSPLARLSFGVALLETEPDRKKAAARIRKEVDRLAALVSSLIEMTRAEGDPAARQMRDVRLDSLLGDVVADCSVEAAARGCSISAPRLDASSVRGDEELLRRALENVLRNAVRYSPPGGQVDVALSCEPGMARISVRDYGPGVPEAQLEQIFLPFFRADEARAAETGGIGLGLAIGKRAVELHNGRIEARNAGPGLLVTITLPDATPAG